MLIVRIEFPEEGKRIDKIKSRPGLQDGAALFYPRKIIPNS